MENETATLTKIKRLIGHITDVKLCGQISQAAIERQRELLKRQAAKKDAESWERIRNLQGGATLYCCAGGTFLGGPFQRGDVMTVYVVQPRVKRLWVTFKGEKYWFGPSGITRYNLQLEAPEKPISETERAFANATGKIISQAGLG